MLGFAAAGVGAVGFTISLCTGALIGAGFAAAGVGMVAGVVVEGVTTKGWATADGVGRGGASVGVLRAGAVGVVALRAGAAE